MANITRLRQLLKGEWGKLTPKMLQLLPAIQNSMVKARGVGRSGATA